jgi:sugar phosphate permease
MRMIEEIARVWKKKKRDVFLEAIQTYIGFYFEWKNQPIKKRDLK